MLQFIEFLTIKLHPPVPIYINPEAVSFISKSGESVFIGTNHIMKVAADFDKLPAPFCDWPVFHEVLKDGEISLIRVNPYHVVDIAFPIHATMSVPDEDLEFPEEMPEFIKQISRDMLTKNVPLPICVNALINLHTRGVTVSETVLNVRAMLMGQPIPDDARIG